MMFQRLPDPGFPALAGLGPAALARIANTPKAGRLRLRYQPGGRAVLDMALASARFGGVGRQIKVKAKKR